MRIIIDARLINEGKVKTLLLGILKNLDYKQNEYTIIGDEKNLKPLGLPYKIIHEVSKSKTLRGLSNRKLIKLINTYDGYFSPTHIIPQGIKINSYCVIDNFKKRQTIIRSYRAATTIFTTSDTLKSEIIDYFGKSKDVVILNTDLMQESSKRIEGAFTNETKDSNVTRNFIFNIVYQFLVVITPLITAPYLARVLGANNIGKFSFAYTIVAYFVIFAYLGFQQYAQRAIAEVKDDKEEQSRRFWQIVILRLITVSISLGVLFILYRLGVFGEYSSLILVFSILIGATAFDINFYFHGKEKFFLVMIINLTIRFIYLLCVFLFIRSTNNLPIYALLYALMVLVGYISMWAMLPSNLKKVKLKGLNIKQHLSSSLILFLPVAAVSIYALLDKTLIGLLVHGDQYFREGYITILAHKADIQNGYYFQSEKIIKALLSILLAIGTVMTTRNSIEYKNDRFGEIKKNIYRSFRLVFAIGVPLMFGTIIIANSFVPLYFGKNYSMYPQYSIDGVANLLIFYAPVILISGCSNILGAQYLLPTKQDKKYTISVGLGFVLNLLFNCILIPFLGALGAIVGTLISETFILLYQYLSVRKDFSFRYILLNIWKYFVAGMVMFIVLICVNIFILNNYSGSNILNLVVLIPTGVLIYYLSLMILKDHYAFRYTRMFIVALSRFFHSASNNEVVQSTSFVTTVAATTHFNHITNRRAANYSKKEKKVNAKK